MDQPETEPKSTSVFAVFTRGAYYEDRTASYNLECVYKDQQAAIDRADEIFRQFDGCLGLTVLEARLNEACDGVGPIYVRDATTRLGGGAHE